MSTTEPPIDAPGEQGVRAGPASILSSIGGAVVGFVLVASWGLSATPPPEDFPITTKLQHLEEHIGEYDTLFVGRSHIFRSFIPEIIDGELSQLGVDMSSFNLGGPGMPDVEIDYVLRRVLAMDGQNLRTLFIEAPDWVRQIKDNAFTNRSIAWHTARQTGTVFRTLAMQDLPLQDRFLKMWDHLRMFGQRLTAFGQGRRIFDDLQGLVEDQPLSLEDVSRDCGYQALDNLDDPSILKRREGFLKRRGGYRNRLDFLAKGNTADYNLERYNEDALASQMALVRAAGARLIYIVPPGMDPTPHAHALREAGLIPDLMTFNDPRQQAFIYQFDLRFDGHLNRAGAEEFSRIFARAFSRFE